MFHLGSASHAHHYQIVVALIRLAQNFVGGVVVKAILLGT